MSREISENHRFLIVSPGRTGTSLLSAILADSGADFGMAVPDGWSRGTGVLEYPAIRKAGFAYYAAHRISAEKPATPWQRLLWVLYRHHGRNKLRRALAAARYLKSDHIWLAASHTVKLGYIPKFILSYRRFEPYLLSKYPRGHSHTFESVAEDYKRTYRNGLSLMKLWGGCAIDYDELYSTDETGWAGSLASVTGLSGDALLASRADRVAHYQPRDSSNIPLSLDREVEQIYEELRKFRGVAIPSSRSKPEKPG